MSVICDYRVYLEKQVPVVCWLTANTFEYFSAAAGCCILEVWSLQISAYAIITVFPWYPGIFPYMSSFCRKEKLLFVLLEAVIFIDLILKEE